jgi:hypothetical protein
VQEGKRFFCRRFALLPHAAVFAERCFFALVASLQGHTRAHSHCLTIADFHVWRTRRIPLTYQLFVINIDLRNLHAHRSMDTAD